MILRSLLPAFFLLMAFSSCTRYKDLVLLQDKTELDTFLAIPPTYEIQKRDVLYLRILSLNQEITQLINATNISTAGSSFNNESGLYIYGYNVNDSGYMEIPVIGEVFVLGKTLEEAKVAIEEKTALYLKDATVIVKLISFKYSVLGEVRNPGVFQNYNNQLTVLEAISKAGDISPYGNRHKILIVRPGVEKTQTYRLDLTNTQILASEGFFLLPNDIVYVEPVKSYNFKVNIPTIALVLSGASTLILLMNFLYNTR